MRARGFTLLELAITVLIVAVLATIGLPGLQDIIARIRLKTAASDLHTALTFARSEAIKRNSATTLVPVDASDWSKGWSVRAGSTVLAVQDAYTSLSFSPRNAAYGSKTVSVVTFAGTGRESSTGNDGIAFVLTSTTRASLAARCIALDPSGRAAVREDLDGNASNGCS